MAIPPLKNTLYISKGLFLMSSNWVANLDLLSANGILDYDAAAYLRGTPPRYIGNPSIRTSPQPIYPTATGVALPPPLQGDSYNDKNTEEKDSLYKNPTWKKVLFAVVTTGALIWGGYKLRNSKLGNWVKTKMSNLWNWVKKPFSKHSP